MYLIINLFQIFFRNEPDFNVYAIKAIRVEEFRKFSAGAGDGEDSGASKKNKGPKRSKTEHLKIDATVDIQPDNIPEGSTFKGYREVVIKYQLITLPYPIL